MRTLLPALGSSSGRHRRSGDAARAERSASRAPTVAHDPATGRAPRRRPGVAAPRDAHGRATAPGGQPAGPARGGVLGVSGSGPRTLLRPGSLRAGGGSREPERRRTVVHCRRECGSLAECRLIGRSARADVRGHHERDARYSGRQDIGVGPNGVERGLIPGILVTSGWFGVLSPRYVGPLPVNLPAGTRLSVGRSVALPTMTGCSMSCSTCWGEAQNVA